MENLTESPPVTRIHDNKPQTMTFADSLEQVLSGKKIRRLEWEDEGIYLVLQLEQVMIFKTDNNQLQPLIVSAGDIVATDWVVRN